MAKVTPHGPDFLPLNWAYPGLKRVHEKPPIYVIESFLSDKECEALINVAEPLLQRSKTHAAAGAWLLAGAFFDVLLPALTRAPPRGRQAARRPRGAPA